MGLIDTAINTAFRDYVTDGVPSSGINKPSKSEIRTAGQTIQTQVDTRATIASVDALTDRVDEIEATATAGVKWTTFLIEGRSTGNVNLANGLENGDTLNGLTVQTGKHYFLGLQTDPAQNGIYTAVASGAASRATFADSAAELAYIGFVLQGGTVGTGERWTLPLAAADITVGTTALNFAPQGVEPGYAAEVAAARGGEASLSDAMALKANDNAVVKLTGAQTVVGVKTFSDSPVVPDASFAIAKTSGLQAALDAKASAADLTAEVDARTGLIAEFETLDGDLAGMVRAKDSTGSERMLSRTKGDGTHVVEAIELPNSARITGLETLDGELHKMRAAANSDGVLHVVDALNMDGRRPGWFDPEPPDEGHNTLRMTGTRMGQIRAAAGSPVAINAQLVIDMHGTSITWNPYWYSGILKRRLDALLGDGGYGWIDLTNGSEASTPQALSGPCIRVGAVTAVLTGSWVAHIATQPATNGGFQQSSTVGDKVTITATGSYAGPNLSSAKLHSVGTADGEVRYRWNGGSWTTLSVAGSGLLVGTLASPPTGSSWTLEIEVTAGTVKIAGVDLRSAANGVIVNKLAMNGATIAQLAAIDEASWIAAKQALAADLSIFCYSTNDQVSRTEAQFEGNLNTVVSRTLAARPYSDILIITEAENVRLSPNRMQIYARAARRVARAYDVGYIDMTAFMKGSAKANGYDGRKFFNYAGDGVDLVHPSTEVGAPKMAEVLYRYLTR